MKNFNVDLEMLKNLAADNEVNSKEFKLSVALNLLDKAAICFEKANQPKYSEQVSSLMEKLASKI